MRIRRKIWARPELDTCKYYIQNPKELRGKWISQFADKQPIHLDLGCGKGVFLAQIAYNQPEVNYIGIDISMDILGVAKRNIEKTFVENLPTNLLFFNYNIERLGDIFTYSDKIDRIYINFCNPWPKARGHKRRLTHPRQLREYFKFLSPQGEIWFKTDDDDLYLATERYFKSTGMEIFYMTKDLYKDKCSENVTTEHELMFSAQGIPIKAIKARWNGGNYEGQT